MCFVQVKYSYRYKYYRYKSNVSLKRSILQYIGVLLKGRGRRLGKKNNIIPLLFKYNFLVS